MTSSKISISIQFNPNLKNNAKNFKFVAITHPLDFKVEAHLIEKNERYMFILNTALEV